MHLRQIVTALTGFSCLAAAAPTQADQDVNAMPVERGLKHKTKFQKRLTIENIIVEPQVTIVEQNLGLVNQLAQIAEKEFAQLIQAQVALVTELQTIMNNIRINHFRAKFSQVNTIIVTVTNIVDARDPRNVNKRYLMNQVLADNGFPNSQLVVMVTQQQEMTIGATPTLDLAGLGIGQPSAVSKPTVVPNIAQLDRNSPFGNLNQSLILPYNTTAPTNALVFEDPANIIFANQRNFFVESVQGFQSDCAQFGASASSLINLAAAQVFASIEQAAAAQLASLQLGSLLVPNIPPSVLANNPSLASQLAAGQAAAAAATQPTVAPVATPAAASTAPAAAAPVQGGFITLVPAPAS